MVSGARLVRTLLEDLPEGRESLSKRFSLRFHQQRYNFMVGWKVCRTDPSLLFSPASWIVLSSPRFSGPVHH